MSFEGLVLRRISEDPQPNIAGFACGRESLDDFLSNEALDFHKAGLTFTTLVYLPDGNLAGYFSLSSDAVKLTTSETGNLGLNFKPEISFFPAVKITRFAIAKPQQKSGLGSHLLKLIEGMVYSDHVATRVLTVDALNEPDVIAFYKKAGFLDCLVTAAKRGFFSKKAPPPATIHMYKDIYSA